MKRITHHDLQNSYGPKDFTTGEEIRLYTMTTNRTEVKEGTVVNPDVEKKDAGYRPAIEIKIKRYGIVIKGSVRFWNSERQPNSRFLLSSIKLVEKSVDGEWKKYEKPVVGKSI